MRTLGRFSRRPQLAAALSAAALLFGVGMFPISYERTIGHNLQITLQGAGLSDGQIGRVAKGLKRALSAEAVQLRAEAKDGRTTYTLIVRLATRSRSEAEGLAAAAVKGLSAQSIAAQAQVLARTEEHHGRVYAMAMERVIQIRVDMAGKTDAQVAEEIRAQLQAAGIADPQVAVERRGDETRVQIGAEEEGRELRIDRRTVGDGPALQMDIGGIDDRREPGMTDEQLREKIERQLRARGLEPTVTVRGDEIQIQARHREGR